MIFCALKQEALLASLVEQSYFCSPHIYLTNKADKKYYKNCSNNLLYNNDLD